MTAFFRRVRDLMYLTAAAIALFVVSGCEKENASDAYGNFEASEVTISAEAQGRLLRFEADEGDFLDKGEAVGLVDTTKLAIQRRGLRAQRQSLRARREATLAQLPEITAQIGALRAQLETAADELARTRRLYENQAATERELNQHQMEVTQTRYQIEQAQARSSAVRKQAASISAQIDQINSQLAELGERIRDASLVNPVAGTVLTAVAEQGETVQPGTPLYTIADLDTLTLRAYATGAQLPQIRLGMSVAVLIDRTNGELRTLRGEVAWIADQAQFTPTPIQTRENRAELVYAFDVRVPNPDGLLKVGMPGEVRFSNPPAANGDDLETEERLPEPAGSEH